MYHGWHPSCILPLDMMIRLKIVKQYEHVAINDCPETTSENLFPEKIWYMFILRSKNSRKILQIPHAF